MSIEGIFRKNGNIRRLKDLTDSIDRDASSVDITQDNPVQLAALLKKFLRDLPDPLLTFKLHRLFNASQSKSLMLNARDIHSKLSPTDLPQEADRQRLLHMISIILPKSHRDTMEVLFVFLKWVASFAHMDEKTGSKMDLGNLATVICPSILYSRGREAGRDESFGAIKVVTALLEHQDEFFTVPEEFRGILQDQEYFSSSMELSSKEFMKKCDTYMKFKSNGRQMGARSPVPSPLPDAMVGASSSNRNTRQFSSPSMSPSLALSGGAAMAQTQPPSRTPQMDDWPATPRPVNSNTPTSRPTSYIQPRPSNEHSHSLPTNGYQPQLGLRQRT
jgi:hypothetical protein